MALVYRRHIPILITFIMGIMMIVQFFLVPPKPVEPYQKALAEVGEALTNWANLLAAFTIGFGLVNLFFIHGRHVTRRTPGQWYYSAWLLFVMFIMVIFGIFGDEELGISTATTYQFEWMYKWIYTPLSGTMYASLAFYITSASYRAFRARTLEAGVLLIVGLLVLFKLAPVWQVYLPQVIPLVNWIYKYIVTSSYRGILIGAGIGAILLGIRTIIGLETGYLGRRE